MGQWYSTGTSLKKVEDAEKEQTRRPIRLWLPIGGTKEVVFLDDEGFSFWEHGLKRGGRWDVVTCLSGLGPICPGCETGIYRFYSTLFTVIDTSGWTDRKGVVHQFSKVVLALKTVPTKKIVRQKEKYQGLIGKKFKLYRDSEKEAFSDFEFISEVDIKTLGIKNFETYDYKKIYAPVSPQAFKSLLATSKEQEENVVEHNYTNTQDDDDIPY